MIAQEEIAVNGIEVSLTYENRMQLINMLTHAAADETTTMRVTMWAKYDDKSQVEISLGNGFGIITDMTQMAVKLKNEGNES